MDHSPDWSLLLSPDRPPCLVQLPRLSSTVLVLARAPATAFHVSGNRFKILFIQRSSKSGFMASAHVFPGGVLDDADRKADLWTPARCATKPIVFPIKTDTADSMALRLCAIRELFEETGLLLARPVKPAAASPASALPVYFSSQHTFPSISAQSAAQAASSANAESLAETLTREGAQLEPLKLAPWMRWITPEFEREKRRFDTLFYLAALDRTFEPLTSDPKEVAASCWLSPVEALSLAQERKIVLPPPTTYILREIEHLETIEQVFAHVPNRDCRAMVTKLAAHSDERTQHMTFPGDPSHPSADGQPTTEGEAASSPAAGDQSRWHRMVRALDERSPITTIYRPKELHLEKDLASKL